MDVGLIQALGLLVDLMGNIGDYQDSKIIELGRYTEGIKHF